jgi:Zn-dependent metalloprotease
MRYMTMKNVNIVLAILVVSMTAMHAAVADTSASGTRRALARAGVQNLLASVDVYAASERPRLGKAPDASLRFFGAPPDAPARLDAALSNASPEEKALGFLRQHAAAFGVYNPAVAFDVKRVRATNNRTFVHLSQAYTGLAVFGAEIVVQLDADKGVAAVLADIMRTTSDLDNDASNLTPAITRDDAERVGLDKAAETIILESRQSAALSAMQEAYHSGTTDSDSLVATAVECFAQTADSTGNQMISSSELQAVAATLVSVGNACLMLYDPEVIGNKGAAALVWQVTVAAQSQAGWREVLLVDAHTGQVRAEIPLFARLLDRAIYDCEESDTYPGQLVRGEGDPPTYDPANPYTGGEEVEDADLVYDYFGDAYDFYYDHHNRDSIDDDGKTLRAEVRYCMDIEGNEFCQWGAAWHIDQENEVEQLLIGTGGFAVDDCIAHEFTHGVTFHESELLYLNESGAINESLSDVWGEYVDLTNGRGYDNALVDYLIGEELPELTRLALLTYLTGTWIPAPALRNMGAPSNYQSIASLIPLVFIVHADRYNGPDFYRVTEGEGGYDHGGVHYNCGVNNKLCYLVTDGGIFNGRLIQALGIDLMADVYYECQTNLLVPGSDYRDLYFALSQAALNLGLSAAQRQNIEEACDAVEISSMPYVAIKDEYGHAVVQFHDNGNVVLQRGQILTEQTISPSPGVSEFILTHGQNNELALVDSTSGDLYLKGNLYQDVSVVWSIPDNLLTITNDEEPVAFINAEGYFDPLLEPDFPWYVPAGSLILQGHAVYLGF